MKLNLEDKSPQYIEMLRECIETYKEAEPGRIAAFIKYADKKTGVIRDRNALLKLMAPDITEFLFMLEPESMTTFIIVNGTMKDRELINEQLGHVVTRKISAEKAHTAIEKFDGLLWIQRKEWASTIMKLHFICIVEDLIYMQELNAPMSTSYFFDDLNYLTPGKQKKEAENV